MDQSDKILQAISKLEKKVDSSFRRINQRLDSTERELKKSPTKVPVAPKFKPDLEELRSLLR